MKRILTIAVLLLLSLNCAVATAQYEPDKSVITLLSALNIMVGDENGNLNLDKPVTRAEFVKIAVASSDFRNSVAKSLKITSYKDVPATYWGAPYIKTGVDNGFCKGYTDSTFRPDNPVTYEEAVTMLLRVLGYTDEDFGNSWPYGQVGIAENLGISDGTDAVIGEALTRGKVAMLVYNMLDTKQKGTATKHISIFETQKMENVILISVNDARSKEVYTSKGTFKFDTQINYADLGKSGDLYVKDSEKVIAFVATEQENDSEKHIVYSMLDNSVVTYNNGSMTTLTIPASTAVYENDVKTTYAAKSAEIEMGDVLYVSRKTNNDPDYIIFEEGNVEGPYTVSGSGDVQRYSGAKVLRDGANSDISKIQQYDIIYYIPDLNMLLGYSNKIVGVYESAEPNKDAPAYVTVSGVKYKVESGTAFEKLSSGGEYKFGDTVILRLGKNNDVADVFGIDTVNNTVYGYILETGTKEYTKSDLSKYTGHYIKVVTPDGTENEYIADREYDNYVNSVKKITFENGMAKVSYMNLKFGVSGTINWTGKTMGDSRLSPDLKILDIATDDSDYSPAYLSVLPGRLDGAKISADNVLYADYDEKGQIISLILRNATGDAYKYALLTKVDIKGNKEMVSGSYTYDIGGTSYSATVGVNYNVSSGQPVRMLANNNSIELMQPLSVIKTKITDVTYTYITAGGIKYPIADNVTVYKKDKEYNYTVIPMADIIDNDEYTLTVYHDMLTSPGGKVRIIIAK